MLILFSPEYLQYTLLGIILLPGMIFAIITSAKVNSTFLKYNKVLSSKGYSASDVVKKILENEGVYDVEVIKSSNPELVDNYNPKTKTVTLSAKVFQSTSIAALGIAAHETGHAIQDAKGYVPLKARNVLATVGGVISTFVWPLILIGIILDFAYVGGIVGKAFLWAGVGFFSISLIFSLITLPVELDASKRALKLLVANGFVDEMEVKGAKKVLSAAAMTYVAAIVVSILQLLRFVLFFLLNSRRSD